MERHGAGSVEQPIDGRAPFRSLLRRVDSAVGTELRALRRLLREQERGRSEVQRAAPTLGLEVATFEIRQAEDIAPAFEALQRRAEALCIPAVPLMFVNRVRINTLALAARLPTMYGVRKYVEGGGLLSYGPN